MWSSCRKKEFDPVGSVSQDSLALDFSSVCGQTRASDKSSLNHGWYMLVVFRIPFTPVTKTAHDFSSIGLSRREEFSTAPSQFPSLITLSRSCRPFGVSG